MATPRARALLLSLLSASLLQLSPLLLVGSAAAQDTPLAGAWRWEGTDKKIELTQNGTTLTGKIKYRDGSERVVEGSVSSSGSVELAEYFPRSAADNDMTAAVWAEVVRQRGDAGHPDLARGKIKLQYSQAKNTEMSGERTYFSVTWKRSTGKFESLKDEQESIKLYRIMGTCGPDVTTPTMRVLKKMADEFLADKESRSAKCSGLVSLQGMQVHVIDRPLIEGAPLAEFAWDITTLFQDAGQFPSDKPGRPKNGAASRWERMTGGKCAVGGSRYPCVKSVEFYGMCHDPHVVNYTMWGMTKELCKGEWGINTQQAVAAWARNRKSPDKADQDVMIEFGQKYGGLIVRFLKDEKRYRELAEKYRAAVKAGGNAVERFYKQLPSDLTSSTEEFAMTRKILSSLGPKAKDTDLTNQTLFEDLRQMVIGHESSSNRPTKWCEATCSQKLKPDELKDIYNMEFDYRWVGEKAR